MDTTQRQNPDTPARWNRALERAFAQNVAVRQLRNGAWIATRSGGETAYQVTEIACDCHAGEAGDPVCKHRAMLRYLLGTLDVEPMKDAATRKGANSGDNCEPAPVCRECGGSGMVRYHQGGGLSNWIEVRCRRCSPVLAMAA
jgi:hypothetical protein